jgi:hypothetical protein
MGDSQRHSDHSGQLNIAIYTFGVFMLFALAIVFFAAPV